MEPIAHKLARASQPSSPTASCALPNFGGSEYGSPANFLKTAAVTLGAPPAEGGEGGEGKEGNHIIS